MPSPADPVDRPGRTRQPAGRRTTRPRQWISSGLDCAAAAFGSGAYRRRVTASLPDQLRSPDDHIRLRAARRAGVDGGPELVDVLLDLALHDPAEVQTTGGLAEVWTCVGSAAA